MPSHLEVKRESLEPILQLFFSEEQSKKMHNSSPISKRISLSMKSERSNSYCKASTNTVFDSEKEKQNQYSKVYVAGTDSVGK
jgi:esterase/lipase superfamily enzyme